ncbi:MAG: SDR family oxidoreductase [Anaerolineales bacterium]|nr:MAG: SDR family oxidoreductase [Anaerolineales bacterium]
MKTWQDSTAFITGAGSGIGRALAQAIAARGGYVYLADVDGAAAQAAAANIGARATAVQLDVRDADAFRARVHEAAQQRGKLDFLFNNAGIGIAGEAYEIPAEAWQRIIDINVGGTLNGIAAAYPLMVQQRSGHIINTASLAGLGPAPLLAPYSMTKHAIVGLSHSLRIEAAAYGVRVSVLCPASVETPMLDAPPPADIKDMPWTPDVRRFLTKLAGLPYPADKFAAEALRGVEKNAATIVAPARARMVWYLGRLAPGLVEKASLGAVASERASRA